MKISVKILSLLIPLLWGLHINAQSPPTPTCGGVNSPLPCNYTPDWQWSDATPSNWQAQIGSSTTTMSCPFTSNSNTDDMVAIIDGLDYKPEQGWVLLGKDFGCAGGQAVTNATPYFILYNKYKSVIRVFLYFGNPNSATTANVILKWSSVNGSSDNNSLLTLSNDFAKSNSSYPITNNPEKHVNYLNTVPTSGGWSVTEYLVHFDPNTAISVGNFQYITFDFDMTTVSQVGINGPASFTTQSATVKNAGTPSTHPSDPSLLDYVTDGKKFLGKVPKKSELESVFSSISTAISGLSEKFSNRLTDGLSVLNTEFQTGSLKSFLLDAAGFVPEAESALGTVASVMGLFSTKSNSAVATNTTSNVQPTISKGDITLSGTITTSSNPLNISLQLPGTSHKYSDGTFNCPNLPVYDCPLGVISLQDAPTIAVRSWTEAARTGSYVCSIDFDIPSGSCGAPSAPNPGVTESTLTATSTHTTYRRTVACAATYTAKSMKSYKVTGDVSLALNGSAGVQLEVTQAALYFEIKNNSGTPAINILDAGPSAPASCCNGTVQLPSTITTRALW